MITAYSRFFALLVLFASHVSAAHGQQIYCPTIGIRTSDALCERIEDASDLEGPMVSVTASLLQHRKGFFSCDLFRAISDRRAKIRNASDGKPESTLDAAHEIGRLLGGSQSRGEHEALGILSVDARWPSCEEEKKSIFIVLKNTSMEIFNNISQCGVRRFNILLRLGDYCDPDLQVLALGDASNLAELHFSEEASFWKREWQFGGSLREAEFDEPLVLYRNRWTDIELEEDE